MELKMFNRRMWPGGQVLFDISSQVLTTPDDVTIKEHAYPLFMGPNNEKFALQAETDLRERPHHSGPCENEIVVIFAWKWLVCEPG